MLLQLYQYCNFCRQFKPLIFSICCFLVCSSLKWACPTLTTSRLKIILFFYFRRDPASLVKPEKDSSTELTEKDLKNIENDLKKKTPTASRHLLFIRHGQYNTDGPTDLERYLTPLGKCHF